MLGLIVATIAMRGSVFVDMNSRVVDQERFVTLRDSAIELHGRDARILSVTALPTHLLPPQFSARLGEGPALEHPSNRLVHYLIRVNNNDIEFHEQYVSAYILKEDASKLNVTFSQSGKPSEDIAIEPADTYASLVGSSFDESYFLQASISPMVVVMGVVIGLEHTMGTSWYTFVIQDGIARRLMSSMPYMTASYVDDQYILGVATDIATADWPKPTPDLTPKTLSPFICRLSDLSVTILKKIEFAKIPIPNSEYDYFGDVYVTPMTVDSTGTLVLCNRSKMIKPTAVHPEYEFMTKPPKFKRNVVLFRNGQAEVLGKMQVEGQTVTPTRVISAKGTFAILEGTDSKGKTVAFTYHLR